MILGCHKMTWSSFKSKVVAISGTFHAFDQEVPKGTSYMVGTSIAQLGGLRQCHFNGCVKYAAKNDRFGSGARDHIHRICVVEYLPTANELSTLPLNPQAVITIEFGEDRTPIPDLQLEEDTTPRARRSCRVEEYVASGGRRRLRREINDHNARFGIPPISETDPEIDSTSGDGGLEELVYPSGRERVPPAVLHGVNIRAVMDSFFPLRDSDLENGPVVFELWDNCYRNVVSRLHCRDAPFAEMGEDGDYHTFHSLTMMILVNYWLIFPGIRRFDGGIGTYAKDVIETLVEHAKATVATVPAGDTKPVLARTRRAIVTELVTNANVRDALLDRIAGLAQATIQLGF